MRSRRPCPSRGAVSNGFVSSSSPRLVPSSLASFGPSTPTWNSCTWRDLLAESKHELRASARNEARIIFATRRMGRQGRPSPFQEGTPSDRKGRGSGSDPRRNRRCNRWKFQRFDDRVRSVNEALGKEVFEREGTPTPSRVELNPHEKLPFEGGRMAASQPSPAFPSPEEEARPPDLSSLERRGSSSGHGGRWGRASRRHG